MGEIRQRGSVWWVRYYREGRRFEESSGSDKYDDARRLLGSREGDIERGIPVTPKLGRVRFAEAVTAVENGYAMNAWDTVNDVKRRVKKHLKPFLGGGGCAGSLRTSSPSTWSSGRGRGLTRDDQS
jgi:hypothetical protein